MYCLNNSGGIEDWVTASLWYGGSGTPVVLDGRNAYVVGPQFTRKSC